LSTKSPSPSHTIALSSLTPPSRILIGCICDTLLGHFLLFPRCQLSSHVHGFERARPHLTCFRLESLVCTRSFLVSFVLVLPIFF
jgi:hypothetical protein